LVHYHTGCQLKKMASSQMMLYTSLVLFAIIHSSLSLTFTAEDGSLICNGTGMTLQINFTKFSLHGRPFKMHFINTTDPACSVPHNSTDSLIDDKLQIHASYKSCGIDVFQRGDDIVYNQTVLLTYGSNPDSQLVYREEDITFAVECTKRRNSTVYLESLGHVNVTAIETPTFRKVGNATFDIVFNRKTDNLFNETELSSALILGDTIYFELELKSQRKSLKISPQTCYATNARDSSQKYYLIQNRCPNKDDDTIKISNETSTNQLFHWEAESFRFFGPSDAVYFACDVVVCESSNPTAACERCTSQSRRRRRDLESNNDDGKAEITVASPIFVLIDAVAPKSQQKESINVEASKDQNYSPSSQDSGIFSGTKGTIILILTVCIALAFTLVVVKAAMTWRKSTASRTLTVNEKL